MTKRITAAEWRSQEWASMSEREFQDGFVIPLAEQCGWMVYHTYDSRRSQPGFPDLVMLRRGRILVRELKSERGKLTAPQKKWLTAFSMVGISAVVWRPRDWPAIVGDLK